MFRFKKPATATYTAPAQSAAAITITWTTNEPTASTLQTIADGDAPTSTELGQSVANIVAQLNQLRTDLIATNTALAKVGVDDADLRTVLAEPN
jgi:hypothetical protein